MYIKVRIEFYRSADLVWTASGMGQWKEMIRITCDTDCYYCTIKLSSPLLVYDFCDAVIIPDILILLHWGNSSCICSGYGDIGYVVYIWGFSCLDYSFDVLILWNRKLSLYRRFCRVCFHRVLLQISGFMIIIIIVFYMFTSCLTSCDLFHQSPALNILYYACTLLDITYYLFAWSCMLVLMTQF